MRTVTQEFRQVAPSTLIPHPKNPRRGDVDAISDSIEVNGFYGAIIIQKSTRYVLAGNHRLQAALRADAEMVPVIEVDCDDATATRILLSDNKTSDNSDYDDRILAQILQICALEGLALGGTGYQEVDLDILLASIAVEDDVPIRDGKILEMLDVSMADPRHVTHRGQHWAIGPHVLVVTSVHKGWQEYVAYLTGDVTFAPYPTPMLPVLFSEGRLVMVQPSTYMAGHVIDKYESRFGPEKVRLLP